MMKNLKATLKFDTQFSAKKRTDRPLSTWTATFNFVVLMVGTSLVATPSAFSLTTPILGIFAEIFLGFMAWMSAVSIFNTASIVDATSFIELGKKTFDKNRVGVIWNWLFIILPNFILLTGALGAYIIIASTTFEDYIGVDISLMRFLVACVVFVLGSIRSFNGIKFISYICFVTFLLIVSFTLAVTFDFYGEFDYPDKPFNASSFITGLPILALGLNGHPALPGMAAEMKKSKHSVMPYYLLLGQYIVVIFNSAVGYFPSVMFGSTVEGNIMTQLNDTYQAFYNSVSPLLLAANIMLSIVVVIQAPLLVIPLKELALDRNGLSVRERSILTNVLASLVITAIAGSIAIFIPDLNDALNTIATVGSLLITGPTSGILTLINEKTRRAKIRGWALIIVGIVLLGFNFYTIYVSF